MSSKSTPSIPGGKRLTHIELLERCRQRRADRTHEEFCFELFRRALVEDDEGCWSAIYEQYRNLVYNWILKLSGGRYAVGIMTIEDIAQEAFRAFKRSYTAEKLAAATGVGSILKYLKSTVISATQYAKQKAAKEHLHDDWAADVVDAQHGASVEHQNPEIRVLNELDAEALWQIIDDACRDEREQLVARLSFVSNLKPRRIMAQYPHLFETEERIYKLRKNLIKRLQRNTDLLELLGR